MRELARTKCPAAARNAHRERPLDQIFGIVIVCLRRKLLVRKMGYAVCFPDDRVEEPVSDE